MTCFVPDEHKDKRWHVLRPHKLNRDGEWSHNEVLHFEIAEWVNNEENGPTERGHWVRWGCCGDFPSLCHADYVGPFPDPNMLEKAA